MPQLIWGESLDATNEKPISKTHSLAAFEVESKPLKSKFQTQQVFESNEASFPAKNIFSSDLMTSHQLSFSHHAVTPYNQ